MMYNSDLAIVIAPHDSYLDVLREYMKLFKKNWNDCPFELIVVTNTLPYTDERVKALTTTATTQWTGRILEGIKNTSCRYIFTCMEDGFISKKVDTAEVLKIIEFIKRNNILYYRNPKYDEQHDSRMKIDSFPRAYRIRKNEVYGVNCGYVIWDRNELLKIFRDGSMTGWQVEDYFNQMALHADGAYYKYYLSDINNFMAIRETVTRGKWIPSEIRKINKMGIKVNLGNRAFLSNKEIVQIKVFRAADFLIPIKMRNRLKKLMSKIGFKFVTNN